jgi:hypothetical protein
MAGHRVRRIVRHAWPLPWTLVGLTLGLLAVLCGARALRADHTLEIAGGMLGRVLHRAGPRCPFVAITFGHVVLGVDHDTLAALRSHERIHVRQYERWGPLFVPLYLGSSLLQWLRGQDPYRSNCFEREAFGDPSGGQGTTGRPLLQGAAQVAHVGTHTGQRLEVESLRDQLQDRSGVVGGRVDMPALDMRADQQRRNP